MWNASELNFSEKSRMRPVSRRSFSELLESRGITSRREGHGNIHVLEGLRLDATRCSAPYARNEKNTADTASQVALSRSGPESLFPKPVTRRQTDGR